MGSQENRRTGEGSRTQPVVLLEPAFVEMTADEENRAIEALAELLARLLLNDPAKDEGADE